MTMLPGILATLFVTPAPIAPGVRLLLLLPLAASVSVVYKTIRCNEVREIPLASVVLWITVVGGMLAVGIVLLIGYRLLL